MTDSGFFCSAGYFSIDSVFVAGGIAGFSAGTISGAGGGDGGWGGWESGGRPTDFAASFIAFCAASKISSVTIYAWYR